ncbi:hypothetical protein [Paenibacillus alkalitolerans]|uniref:hypothetical protein n=1 Tax=Paenibacillus alkalitolerans TaxID=2799335 RepID=UPI0018F65121|nr:hypothetical protein [Paenibacillus alkalitolerans]
MMSKARIRLDRYERGIWFHLVHHFGYLPSQARSVVIAYHAVINRLGRFDNCEDSAERLHIAVRSGLAPETWLQRIRLIEEDELTDDSIWTAEKAATTQRTVRK